MNDEDELARLLRRVDFHTMAKIIHDLPPTEFREIYKTAADKSLFFLKHGWTVEEFETEMKKYIVMGKYIHG